MRTNTRVEFGLYDVTARGDSAPSCDGKQRRPANLYGSVLSPPPASNPSPPSPLSPAPEPDEGAAAARPDQLSALPTFPSC